MDAGPSFEKGYRSFVRVLDTRPYINCYYRSPLFKTELEAMLWLPKIDRPNPFKPVFYSIRGEENEGN